MDYRRTRQPSTQQPHAARDKSSARPAAREPLPGFGRPAPPTVPMAPGARARAAARATARPTPELGVQGLRYDYTTPVILDAVAQEMATPDLTLSEEETERLRTAQEIIALCKSWLRRPVFDIEYTPGYERYSGDLAWWHDAQLKRKASILRCSTRMIINLEELVRCFIEERPPRDFPLAARLLLEY